MDKAVSFGCDKFAIVATRHKELSCTSMSATVFPTILAPASALGGGVAVLRVSGPASRNIFSKLTGIENPDARFMYLAEFRNKSGRMLDHGLAVFFAGPNSFTG